MPRRFELRDDTSQKFWEVETRGTDVVVHFGRIGTKGQEKKTTCKTAEAATAAAEKLIREKLHKGYVEATSNSNSNSTSTPTSTSTSTPTGKTRCFVASDELLFARGYPHLHVLTDDSPTKPVAIKTAEEALDTLDPFLPAVSPRDVVRRFVLAYLVGRTWGYGPKVTVVTLPERVAERAAALASDQEIEERHLERFLNAHCPVAKEWKTTVNGVSVAISETETYGWRLAEIIHAFEFFLGIELVATKLRDRLLEAHHTPDAWGFWGQDPWRHNAAAHHLALAFATLRWRLAPDTWQKLVAPFRDLESERLLVYSDLLACLADDARTSKCPMYALDLALRRRDVAAIEVARAKTDAGFWRSEAPWLLGSAAFSDLKLGAARKLPAWKQVRFIEEVGRLAIPEVALHIATLLASRSARKSAEKWLVLHADFARPLLERAVKNARDEDERARLQPALDVLAGAKTKESRVLTDDDLDKEMNALFGELEAKLTACKGDLKKERRVMVATFESYCEARAAAGQVIPEAYFGHHLIDWRPKDAKAGERWFALAGEVADE